MSRSEEILRNMQLLAKRLLSEEGREEEDYETTEVARAQLPDNFQLLHEIRKLEAQAAAAGLHTVTTHPPATTRAGKGSQERNSQERKDDNARKDRSTGKENELDHHRSEQNDHVTSSSSYPSRQVYAAGTTLEKASSAHVDPSKMMGWSGSGGSPRGCLNNKNNNKTSTTGSTASSPSITSKEARGGVAAGGGVGGSSIPSALQTILDILRSLQEENEEEEGCEQEGDEGPLVFDDEPRQDQHRVVEHASLQSTEVVVGAPSLKMYHEPSSTSSASQGVVLGGGGAACSDRNKGPRSFQDTAQGQRQEGALSHPRSSDRVHKQDTTNPALNERGHHEASTEEPTHHRPSNELRNNIQGAYPSKTTDRRVDAEDEQVVVAEDEHEGHEVDEAAAAAAHLHEHDVDASTVSSKMEDDEQNDNDDEEEARDGVLTTVVYRDTDADICEALTRTLWTAEFLEHHHHQHPNGQKKKKKKTKKAGSDGGGEEMDEETPMTSHSSEEEEEMDDAHEDDNVEPTTIDDEPKHIGVTLYPSFPCGGGVSREQHHVIQTVFSEASHRCLEEEETQREEEAEEDAVNERSTPAAPPCVVSSIFRSRFPLALNEYGEAQKVPKLSLQQFSTRSYVAELTTDEQLKNLQKIPILSGVPPSSSASQCTLQNVYNFGVQLHHSIPFDPHAATKQREGERISRSRELAKMCGQAENSQRRYRDCLPNRQSTGSQRDSVELGSSSKAPLDQSITKEQQTLDTSRNSLQSTRSQNNLAAAGELTVINLRVIGNAYRTGFEKEKQFPIEPGVVIAGRYQIVEILGEATFSRAVRCFDLLSPLPPEQCIPNDQHSSPTTSGVDPPQYQEVCLKIVNNTKEFFDQSLDEIRLLHLINNVRDPDEVHVIRLYDYFYYKEHTMLVMELLSDNLYEYSKYNREHEQETYFTLPRLQKIAQQITTALEYIHSLSMLHCDLKPENILFVSHRRCEIKVIDFGSSCFTWDHMSSYVQSRSYRAPEVIFGCDYDGRIDVWSLGAILVELVTGDVLFPSETVPEMLARIAAICGQTFPKAVLYEGRNTPELVNKFGCFYEVDKQHGMDEDEDIDGGVPTKITLHNPIFATHDHTGEKVALDKLPYLRLRNKLAEHNMTDALFISFVQDCLVLDHKKRPTSAELLNHPFLLKHYE